MMTVRRAFVAILAATVGAPLGGLAIGSIVTGVLFLVGADSSKSSTPIAFLYFSMFVGFIGGAVGAAWLAWRRWRPQSHSQQGATADAPTGRKWERLFWAYMAVAAPLAVIVGVGEPEGILEFQYMWIPFFILGVPWSMVLLHILPAGTHALYYILLPLLANALILAWSAYPPRA